MKVPICTRNVIASKQIVVFTNGVQLVVLLFLTGATVTIVSSDYTVNESQSSVEVCASLTDIPAGGLECEVVATIDTMDGTKASMSQLGYTSICLQCQQVNYPVVSTFKVSKCLW